MSENSNIVLIQNALGHFDKVAAGLSALRHEYGGVVYEVATTEGMDAAKRARLAIRTPRYEIERVRKEAKAPLLALGKQLDAEASRITAELESLENPIDQQIKAEEARKEAERVARVNAELARVAAIHERIAQIRATVVAATGGPSDVVQSYLDHVVQIQVTEDLFEELTQQAVDARGATIAQLQSLHAAALEREAEAERQKAERAELAKLRAEQAAREAADRAAREEQERVDAERRAAEDAQRRAEQEAKDAELRARQAALDAQEAAQREEARKQAEALAARQKELADQEAAFHARIAAPPAPPAKKRSKRPTDTEIVGVVAQHYGVSAETARTWLAELRLAA
jgi:hypothetical protein